MKSGIRDPRATHVIVATPPARHQRVLTRHDWSAARGPTAAGPTSTPSRHPVPAVALEAVPRRLELSLGDQALGLVWQLALSDETLPPGLAASFVETFGRRAAGHAGEGR